MTEIQIAIILAAGEGTRFWPYSIVRNKAAFPVANVPAIRRIVDDLGHLGVRHFVVVEGTSEELPVCGRHVLYSAVEALKAEFPRCLTGAKLRADFKIPWNFIGPLEFPEGEASRKSTIIFESQDLKNIRIEDIQDLPNDDPEEDIEQPSE